MTTDSPPDTITFVDDRDHLPTALGRLDGPVIGVDVERADSNNYYRRAALVQVGQADHCILIDAITIIEQPELDDFLQDRTVVLHALENDVVPLRAAGVRLNRVHDTAIAATLLGLPAGLSKLLEHALGVTLTGDKDRLQRADWAARPLTREMQDYAAGDVFHLPALWEYLAEKLEGSGRQHWYEQELISTREKAHEDRRDWEKTRGSGKLDPHQRTMLRELWQEREDIAQEFDVAPQRLLRDDALVSLASDPPSATTELAERCGRRGRARKYADRMMAAVRRANQMDPTARETAGRRWTDRDKVVYDALRKARAEHAKTLGLDAGVMCPSRPLWSSVMAEPTNGVELCEAAGLRPWQIEELAEPLWVAYKSAMATAPE